MTTHCDICGDLIGQIRRESTVPTVATCSRPCALRRRHLSKWPAGVRRIMEMRAEWAARKAEVTP